MSPNTSGPKKRILLKRMGIATSIFLGLLVATYFVVTSAAFFKGVILPKLSASLGARVTVSDATISPFSHVVLRELKVQTTGAEPLVTAQEIRAHYSLWKIIGGNITVAEIVLTSPCVTIITNPDGTRNLDPITKSGQRQESKPPSPKSSRPMQIDFGKVAMNNGCIRLVKNYKTGARDFTEVANLNMALEHLKNGEAGKFDLAADLEIDNHPPGPGTNASLQAKLAGNFTFDLTADLKPRAIKGSTEITAQRAGGALAELASLSAKLDCEITPAEIKQLALRFQKSGAGLGELRASGPFVIDRTEGRLQVEVVDIDKALLNLAGAASGLDFGATAIHSTNQIDLTNGGSLLHAGGQVDITRFSLTHQAQATPMIDLQSRYDVTVNLKEESALLQTLMLSSTQNQRPLLLAGLSSPMRLAWGKIATPAADASLNLTLTNLDLADWKPFIGDLASAGTANATLNLHSQEAGKKLTVALVAQVDKLNARFGANSIQQAGGTLVARGEATEFKKIHLGEYRLQLTHGSQPLVIISGSGQFNVETKDADLRLVVEATLARLLQAMPQPGLGADAGTFSVNAQVIRQGKKQTLAGTLVLTNLTGAYGVYKFTDFATAADLDVEMNGDQLRISKAAGTLREGANKAGSFNAIGDYDLVKKTGQFVLKLVDVNQYTLRPFLSPSLGDRKLVSISINSTNSAWLNGPDDIALKSDLGVSKFLVSDPGNTLPSTPLEVTVQLDAGLRNQVLDLRKCQLALSPTARARNALQITGQVDMAKSNAIQGRVKLAAESLDMTPYYDLFADKQEPTAKTQPSPPASPRPLSPPPAHGGEPMPITLPFQNFMVEVDIGRFYLREVEITNWQTGLKLDGGQVTLNPFQLTLNGAPVKGTADLNLGVAGYQYEMTFSADKIPIEPLANSFSPDYRGQAKGELLASAQIKGAGTTGANLQKHLSGQFNLAFTNADIQVVKPKYQALLIPIELALQLPDLTKSPIKWLAATGTMGEGKINLSKVSVVSGMFIADTGGEIPLAAVLTNSPINNWPVNFSLSRSLAEKARLAPPDAPTNTAYVPLPNFIKVGGTVGEPKTHTDKLAILALLAKSAAGGSTGGKIGQILQGAGGVSKAIGGDPGNTNAAPSDQSGTNQPAKPGLLDLLKRPKK